MVASEKLIANFLFLYRIMFYKSLLKLKSCFICSSIFLSVFTFTFATENSILFLKDTLNKASKGDYLITTQNKTYTLFHIYDKSENKLTIEEITLSKKEYEAQNTHWNEWLIKGGKGHTAWVMYEIDLDSGNILDFYSFTHQNWQNSFKEEHFFPTLIQLKFALSSENSRRKAGPPPPPGLIDERPYWQPPLIFNGQTIKDVPCYSWTTFWPNDNTELAGKKIEIYMPQENRKIPSYFPYWLQISHSFGVIKIRVVDSGINMLSPKTSFPRKPPEFTALSYSQTGDLIFQLKNFYHDRYFSLYAAIPDHYPRDLISLPYKIDQLDDDGTVLITVLTQDLKNKLSASDNYYFSFIPKDLNYPAIETPEPIKLPKYVFQ